MSEKQHAITPDPEDWNIPRVQAASHEELTSDNSSIVDSHNIGAGQVLHRQAVAVRSEVIQDPSRVLGHPSNPHTNMDTSTLFPNQVHEVEQSRAHSMPVTVEHK